MQTVSSHITIFIIITTGIVFLLAILIVSLLYLYQKRQIAHDNNVNNLKLNYEKNLLKTQIEIQEQTFQNISREIHDNINLSLTLVKLNLNTLPWDNISKIRDSVNISLDLIGSAIADLSNLSKSMNSEVISNIGLTGSLKIEVNRLITMAHLEVEYQINGEPVFMASEKELIVFRIVQESFNNIIKHSKATHVTLQLNYGDHFLDILIKDNGIGFVKEDCERNTNAGLLNMQTRARSFGGQLIMESRPQKGTQILITVPYH